MKAVGLSVFTQHNGDRMEEYEEFKKKEKEKSSTPSAVARRRALSAHTSRSDDSPIPKTRQYSLLA